MAHVDKGAPPPPELLLEHAAQRYHSLPKSGGILEQDFALLKKMKVAGNIHRVLSRFRDMQGAQIHHLSTSERRLIRALREGGFI